MGKYVALEFGEETLSIRVPDHADVLTLPACAPLDDSAAALRSSLDDPIDCEPLASLVRRRRGGTAAIVVSDCTRPVPYRGENGILAPVIDLLRRHGAARIIVLVATGTHRAMTGDELRDMLPDEAFASGVEIFNHDCHDRAGLRCIGHTTRGTAAWVNARYLDADIKVLTGLVEPHFMAGFSGGRKSICPGLIGLDATHVFHGAAMMADAQSDSLVLDGNPCHDEALEVARLAGCDFSVNVTLDRHKRITGIFCGDMHAAHEAACTKAAATNAIPIERPYDVVLTHAGYAGINHYQAAKAACEAAKAVQSGGRIILLANHTDAHPVGGPHYRRVLPLLSARGPEGFNAQLASPGWSFVPEQWEVQKWAQVFSKLGALDRLVYCSPQITGALFAECGVPGRDGGEGCGMATPPSRCAAVMVQRALDLQFALTPAASLAVLSDGPYGVPFRAYRARPSK
ncbi:MAG: nickel-dependent lactate racemase [Lentisphaerae bacterium]|nr:nickel-dependent lactate racemase [Lentisphaerota bacterium]